MTQKKEDHLKTILNLIILLTSTWAWAELPIHEDRNEMEYNNQYAVILNGYDPVSYFPEGGSTPTQGQAAFHVVYGSRMYHFANEVHMQLFKADPLKYEPTFGSWCAWAMSKGSKAPINPLAFTINGNRLHVFASFNAKANFDEDVTSNEKKADQNWFNFSGETPRF